MGEWRQPPRLSERAVFVYGTLLPGEPRWRFLAPFATEIVEATAPGRLFDTGRGYPAARFAADGPASIPGALVRVAEEKWESALEVLDGVESEGTLYRRVEVVTSAGPAVSYEWLGDTGGLEELPAGWLARRLGGHQPSWQTFTGEEQ
jgi:gamma-glutamylcyclotransferase (GGCT)/AIG2-like uncharacterized protein YtfP